MNQDILDNLIEEVQQYVEASKRDNTPQWTLVYEMQVSILEEAKKRISSLPSDTQWIDTLKRYNVSLDGGEYNHDNGEYVKYSELVELLNR